MEQKIEEVRLAVAVLEDALSGVLPDSRRVPQLFIDNARAKAMLAEECVKAVNSVQALQALTDADKWLATALRKFALALQEENDGTK